MKKALIFLFISVLAVLLVTPKLLSNQVETATVDNLLDMVPPEAYSVMQITLDEYEAGWFTSRARVRASLSPVYEVNGESIAFVFDMNIRHGPVLFTPEGLRLGFAYSRIDSSIEGMEVPELAELGEIESTEPLFFLFAGLGGNLELGFELDEFAVRDTPNAIELGGLYGSLSLNTDNSSVFDFNLSRFAVSVQEDAGATNLAMTGVSVHAEMEDYTRYAAPGISSFAISRLEIEDPEAVVLENLRMDYSLRNSDMDPAYIDTGFSIGIADIASELPLRSAQWSSELNHLGVEVLEKYMQVAMEVQQSAAANPTTFSTEFLNDLVELSIEVVQDRLQFNNNIAANAYNGDHRLELLITWEGLPDLVSIDTIDIRQAIEALDVTLGINADYAALMRSPIAQMVDQYRQEGMLMVDNGRVLVDGRLDDGVLLINGETLPLYEMLGLQ